MLSTVPEIQPTHAAMSDECRNGGGTGGTTDSHALTVRGATTYPGQ